MNRMKISILVATAVGVTQLATSRYDVSGKDWIFNATFKMSIQKDVKQKLPKGLVTFLDGLENLQSKLSIPLIVANLDIKTVNENTFEFHLAHDIQIPGGVSAGLDMPVRGTFDANGAATLTSDAFYLGFDTHDLFVDIGKKIMTATGNVPTSGSVKTMVAKASSNGGKKKDEVIVINEIYANESNSAGARALEALGALKFSVTDCCMPIITPAGIVQVKLSDWSLKRASALKSDMTKSDGIDGDDQSEKSKVVSDDSDDKEEKVSKKSSKAVLSSSKKDKEGMASPASVKKVGGKNQVKKRVSSGAKKESDASEENVKNSEESTE